MKKQLLIFILGLIPLLANAQPKVEIDGICYVLNPENKQASVTDKSPYYKGDIVIPETTTYQGEEYSVTSIGGGAFSGCTGLTSISIPNSVTSIGEEAFRYCTGLTSISIPNSVTSIGIYAFVDCKSLTSPIYNSTLFAYLPTSYSGSYNIPVGIKEICGSAFMDCSSLTSISIPNSVTSIGGSAFSRCTGLTSISIPNSVTSIGEYAFSRCTGLTSITIGNSVKTIAKNAFANCTSLTSITIPNSVTSIGEYAFLSCSGLTSVTILYGMTSIGKGAFEHCRGLTSITIPNSVTSIGDEAFGGCKELKTIWIGNNIKSIGRGAFGGCPKIEDVYCSAVRYPQTEISAFAESYPDYIILHVPAESVKQYKAVVPWSTFKDVVALRDDDYPGGGEGTEKCIKPIISYQNGKLKFSSATRGVEYVYEITDSDIKKDYGAEVQLTATYHISVYATKNGYQNSDVATATLCWIDQQPRTEGITNGIAQVPANAVLIQSSDGILTIQGTDDGTPIAVYTLNGQQAGSAISQNGQAIIGTTLQPGSVAIVKIGQKSVKVVVK